MNKLRNYPKALAWFYALSVNIVLFIFFANTCTIRFRTSDDRAIANHISGVRGKEFATPYIRFINIILAKALYHLYQICREINWFAVAQEAVIFLSMAILVYIITRKLLYYHDLGIAFLLPFCFVGAFAATFYCRIQYTQTSAVGSFSGILLMMFSYKYDGHKISVDKVAGLILTGFSALFRPKAFLLILPFAFVLVLEYAMVPFVKDVVRGTRRQNHPWRYIPEFFGEYRKIILTFLFLMAAYAGIAFIQEASYGERYDNYIAFNSARAHFIDYEQYDYEQIAEELSELGVSKNDYDFMRLWTFADADFITTDLLNAINEVQPKNSGSLKERLKIYIYGYPKRVFIGIYFFTLAVIVLLAVSGRYRWWYAAGLIALLYILDFYFGAIVGRYPYWLMIGVLYSAIAASVYLMDFSRLLNTKRTVQMILTVILCGVLFPFGNEWYVENFNTFQYDYDGVRLYEYLNEREDDIFYIPVKNSGVPALSEGYSVFQSYREGTQSNIVGLGGWSTGHPDVEDAYHARGIYSALQQIDQENVYLFSTREYVRAYQTYLYEHTGRASTYALTNEQSGAFLYKITSDMSGGVKRNIYMENISHGYNSGYDLYEIDMQASVEENLMGKEFDVYTAIEDTETGQRGFFMCYDAEKTRFDDIGQKVALKALIPAEYIEAGKSYHVSLILTGEDGTRYYTDNRKQITGVSPEPCD